jgi:hypothetical protein
MLAQPWGDIDAAAVFVGGAVGALGLIDDGAHGAQAEAGLLGDPSE